MIDTRERRVIGEITLLLAVFACAHGWADPPSGWPSLDQLPLISPENARGLRPVGQLGSPQVEELAWSFDGRYLGLRSANGLTIYRLETEKGIRLVKVRVLAADHAPLSFGFSKHDEAVATCDGGPEISVWDIRSGWARDGVKNAGAGVKALAFSPTERLLAAVTDDGKLRILRGEALDEAPLVLDDHEKGAAGVSIDAKGKWAVTWAGRNDVHVWDLATGNRVASITTPSETSWGLLAPAFVGPGDVLWATAPGATFRWTLPSGEATPKFQGRALLGPGCFDMVGKKGLVFTGKGIGIMALNDGKILRRIGESSGSIVASFEPARARFIAVCDEESLSLHESSSGAKLFSEATGGTSRVLAMSPDRAWILFRTGATGLNLINLRQGGKSRKLAWSDAFEPSVAILDAKAQLVVMRFYSRTKNRSEVAAWRIAGSQLKRLPLLDKEQDEVGGLAFSPKGDVLALGTAQKGSALVKLLSPETGNLRAAIKLPAAAGPVMAVRDLEFSPDGKLLAAAHTEGGLFVLNVGKGQLESRLAMPDGFNSWLQGIRFNQGGTLLAAAPYRGSVLIYDMATTSLKTQIAVEGELSGELDFSPDSTLLACVRSQSFGLKSTSEIVVLDLASSASLRQVLAHTSRMTALYFIEGGKALLSSGYDGSTRLWGATKEKAEDLQADPK